MDTNVLLYGIDAPQTSEKSRIALRILRQGGWALSVQVLQEFYYQATRTTRHNGIPATVAANLVKDYCQAPVQPLTLDILQAAIATHQRYRISYWDAAIIEAARTLGCHTVLSEDLRPGQDFGGILVINPFTPSSH